MKISAPTETGEESPVTSFVQLERYNAIRLVQIVHASLSSLSKVIRGTTLLDAEVQALAGSLLKQEVSRIIWKQQQISHAVVESCPINCCAFSSTYRGCFWIRVRALQPDRIVIDRIVLSILVLDLFWMISIDLTCATPLLHEPRQKKRFNFVFQI